MNTEIQLLSQRVATLERQCRRSRRALCGSTAVVLLFLASAMASEGQGSGPADLRARSLALVDESGEVRLLLGAPIPEPQERSGGEAYGMCINDAKGHERFRLALDPRGSMALSFSAPVGVGDQRDRERMILGVKASGQGEFRLQDNQGRPNLYLRTDKQDVAWAEFVQWSSVDPYVTTGALKYGLGASFGERTE